MFTLQDGREHLYQWDIDRYIIVNDPTICEVHFCNRTSDCSLVVEVKDGLAAIPNILLQDARPIRAYAYCDDRYTLTENQFTVKARTKPSDYVYTETEVITVQTIEKRMDELEDSLGTNIERTVADYLTDNPITVDLSNYYTKEQTDAAIHNSKDTYYLDFRYATEENQPATEDMIAFATRWLEGQNVCAHVRAPEILGIKGYQSVTIQKSVGSQLILTPNGIDPAAVSTNSEGNYFSFIIHNTTTDGWIYKQHQTYQFAIATTDYVDNAIAGSATGDVDLSNYYTKGEVDTAISGKANKEHTHSAYITQGELNSWETSFVSDLEQVYYDKAQTNAAIDKAIEGIETPVAQFNLTDDGVLFVEMVTTNPDDVLLSTFYVPNGVGDSEDTGGQGISYPEGCSWREFINSSYNDGSFYIDYAVAYENDVEYSDDEVVYYDYEVYGERYCSILELDVDAIIDSRYYPPIGFYAPHQAGIKNYYQESYQGYGGVLNQVDGVTNWRDYIVNINDTNASIHLGDNWESVENPEDATQVYCGSFDHFANPDDIIVPGETYYSAEA